MKTEDRRQKSEDRRQRTDHAPRTTHHAPRTPSTIHYPLTSGFTIIEIAICLAIIGFALVAIIGVLPTGMAVQKENRQETIINQDASVFMNAIRNGEQGLDDLTHYVFAITNTVIPFVGGSAQPRVVRWYTGTASNPAGHRLNRGARIIGLLSTPRIVPTGPNSFESNRVVAYVRSLSGPANEKYPQTDPTLQGVGDDLALSYKLFADVVPCQYPDAGGTGVTNEWVVANLTNNLYDLRLTFRWPLLPSYDVGSGRQVFRTVVSGTLATNANDPSLFFFEPRTYVKKLP